MDKEFIRGNILFPNGHECIAVLDEKNHCYCALINDKYISMIVQNPEGKFDAWLDNAKYGKQGIDVRKVYHYLEYFACHSKLPSQNDVSFDPLFD